MVRSERSALKGGSEGLGQRRSSGQLKLCWTEICLLLLLCASVFISIGLFLRAIQRVAHPFHVVIDVAMISSSTVFITQQLY